MSKSLKRVLTVSASVLMLLGVNDLCFQNAHISINASAKRITRYSKRHVRHMKRRVVKRHRAYKLARHKKSVNNKAYKDGKEDGLHLAEHFGLGDIWHNVFNGNKLYNNSYDKGIVFITKL